MINEIDEQFKGYCFPVKDNDWHTPAVGLDGVEQAVRYANIQKHLFYEVRVVGEDDKTVLQAIDGKIVYPVPEVDKSA